MNANSRAVGERRLRADEEAARRWCDLIWGGREGWAQTAIGHKGFYVGTTYRMEPFQVRAYRWPCDSSELLDDLLKAALESDVFVCPLLRDGSSRAQSRSSPLNGRHAWMDADDWDDERQATLLSVGLEVLAVASGGPQGGRHIYLDLTQEYPSEEVTEWSRRLALAFHTDTHGGDNKLLRLPGTFNHKGRAAGGSSGAVRWLP